MREDIKQYVAAIVHGCASTGTWNADTVRRGVEVGMSLRRGSLKPEIGTIEVLIGEVLAEQQVDQPIDCWQDQHICSCSLTARERQTRV